MKKAKVQELKHGLYRVFWDDGGSSLAAVGSMPNGDRWISPTNWVSPGTDSRAIWKGVKKVKLIERSRY